MFSRNVVSCCAALFFLVCISGISFAQDRCKLKASVVDSTSKTTIPDVEITLLDHRNLKMTKRRAKSGTADFEYSADGLLSLKATADGFLSSVVMVPLSCPNVNEAIQIPLYPGKSDINIFLANSSLPRNSNGKIVFDMNHVAVIGQSWPKPSYTGFCHAACEVTVGVEIDETGKVTSARALSGNSALRQTAEDAALHSKFKPVFLNGKFIPVNATMRYIFR